MSVRKIRDAALVMVAFLALIWILQVFNWADGYGLDRSFGILPRNAGTIGDIFTAPFLHFSWSHIEGNSLPLLVLGFLAAYRGVVKFLLVTVIVILTSGLGVWLFQGGNSLTVGASGVIFGYFGYVLLRGIFDRNWIDIGVGIAAGLMYYGILTVAIPGTPGVSWIDHISGLVGGVLAAWVLRSAFRGRRKPVDPGGPSGSSGPSGPSVGGSSGQTRPLGGSSADDLLRQIDEMGI